MDPAAVSRLVDVDLAIVGAGPVGLYGAYYAGVRGLRVAAPGALVVACSCSGQVDRALWDKLVGEAAATAGRTVQVLARRGAAMDHPERLGVPETGHLKCWVMRAL